MKCVICGKFIKKRTDDSAPICDRKKCIKKFVEVFGSVCQAIDEELRHDTHGFFMENKLIRFNNFDEDFEKAWSKRRLKAEMSGFEGKVKGYG